MPQTASAQKALLVSERRRVINDRWRAKLRALERKFVKTLSNKDAAGARTLAVELQSTLDRMARRHIVHRNRAARLKRQLAYRLRRGPPAAAPGKLKSASAAFSTDRPGTALEQDRQERRWPPPGRG